MKVTGIKEIKELEKGFRLLFWGALFLLSGLFLFPEAKESASAFTFWEIVSYISRIVGLCLSSSGSLRLYQASFLPCFKTAGHWIRIGAGIWIIEILLVYFTGFAWEWRFLLSFARALILIRIYAAFFLASSCLMQDKGASRNITLLVILVTLVTFFSMADMFLGIAYHGPDWLYITFLLLQWSLILWITARLSFYRKHIREVNQ